MRLTAVALRRDRVQLLVWLAGMTVLLAASAAVTAGEYPTGADREIAARLIASSPALLLLRGAAADASQAALILADIAPIVTALLALLSVLTVVRHTRQNEDTGRAELVGSTAVGRPAMLAAALLVAIAASLLQGTLFTIVLLANGLPVVGSVAAGVAMAGVGVAFAGIAAVAVQLAATARTASSLTIAVLGAAYLVRGLADVLGEATAEGTSVTPAWPAWLSPFGWAQQVRPFDEASWWLLALPVALFVLAATLAFALRSSRDLGAGLIPPGRGLETAGLALRSPIGLAWRLQRGMLLGWGVGITVMAAVFGSLGQQVRDMASNEQFAEILRGLAGGAGEIGDLFFALAMSILGLATAAYAVGSLLLLRTEEAEGRLEPTLAAGVSRPIWLAAHVACSVVGIIALLGLAGLAAGLAHGLVTGDRTGRLGDLAVAALVQAPAVLVVAGMCIAAFGLVPRMAAPIAWAVLAGSLAFGVLGDMLNFPQALQNLSPFSHVPAVPADPISVAPLVVLAVIGVALATIGAFSFRRRDLAIRA